MAKKIVSVDQLREAVHAEPHNLDLARTFAATIANAISLETADAAVVDGLLEEIRTLWLSFKADENLADLYAMAIANASAEAVSNEVIERNNRLLDELQAVISTTAWKEYETSSYPLRIMAAQYLGLLGQRRFDEADTLLTKMSEQAFGGTQVARLEWLIAVRHGFWIVLEQGESARRVEKQLELVRDFRKRHPEDDYEAPDALLAMLLGAFESAERRGDTVLADIRFEEACSLGSTARDFYGHVRRLRRELLKGRLGEPTRASAFAERLAAIWHLGDRGRQA